MIATSASIRTPRRAARILRQGGVVVRLVFALTMIVQLAAGVVIPALHARLAPPLAAHLDKPGTPHQAHDDASCATCVASHGVGRVERAMPTLPAVLSAVVAATAYDQRTVSRRVDPTRSPRAPPASA